MEYRYLGASGFRVPVLSFGTGTFGGQGALFSAWGSTDVAEARRLVDICLDAGLTMFDSADVYSKGAAEEILGEAIKGRPRDSLILSTKATFRFGEGENQVGSSRYHLIDAVDAALKRLGTDYIDLFLIHWPLPTLYDGDFVTTWKTLEEFKADGRAHSIGVSNFQIHHLEELARETSVTPAVNQIEVHPYFTNDAVRAYGIEHDIATEGWSPIARGKVLGDPTVIRIAKAYGVHPAQVVLRWHIQRGDIVFPKSSHPQRMKDNFEVFDFDLGDEEIEALTALDKGEPGRTGPNPDTFAYIPE